MKSKENKKKAITPVGSGAWLGGISYLNFDDDRINRIMAGGAMADPERGFLIKNIPKFEECQNTTEELAAMSDQDLMRTAYGVWRDYSA